MDKLAAEVSHGDTLGVLLTGHVPDRAANRQPGVRAISGSDGPAVAEVPRQWVRICDGDPEGRQSVLGEANDRRVRPRRRPALPGSLS